MKIEIAEQRVQNVSGTSGKTGKVFSINKQVGWLHMEDQKYPVRIEITLDDNSTGYPPGQYEISAQSFYVDRFSQLQVGRLKLRPIVASADSKKSA